MAAAFIQVAAFYCRLTVSSCRNRGSTLQGALPYQEVLRFQKQLWVALGALQDALLARHHASPLCAASSEADSFACVGTVQT